jgi:hypothetical protein
MSIGRPWSLFLVPPIFAIGFCLSLVGANYYYAQRAKYLLERIRQMPADNSAIAELRRVGSEHGFRYEETTNCGSMPCIHLVAPNNSWLRSLLISTPLRRLTAQKLKDGLPRLDTLLGLRPWQPLGTSKLKISKSSGRSTLLHCMIGTTSIPSSNGMGKA